LGQKNSPFGRSPGPGNLA